MWQTITKNKYGKDVLVDKGYLKDVFIQQIQKVDQLGQKQLFHQQKHNDKQYIPLSVTYNRALPQIPSITTKKLSKLKIIIIQESVSHIIRNAVFAVNNLFQQQLSKVIKPTKHLKSAMRSTTKAASLFILECYIYKINTLLNQIHHSTLTTEKISNIPLQYQLENTSVRTIMILTVTGNSLSLSN